MHSRAGCLCKLPALQLYSIMDKAYEIAFGGNAIHPMVQPEDCFSFAVNSGNLLVTTDFGPLVGTCPNRAGRIAALHAISDIYASGGVPKCALVTFIAGEEELNAHPEFASSLLAGLMQACQDESVELRGGHTVVGQETMIGLTVIGSTPNGIYFRKSGAKVGDYLLLSKPLGVGIMIKARQLNLIGDEEFEEALQLMTTSNKDASRWAIKVKAHAVTDVSGFGLLGHLSEMLGPELGATLNLSNIPVLNEAVKHSEYVGCNLTDANLWYTRSRVRLEGFEENIRFYPLADPQTNGGLLVAVDGTVTQELIENGFYLIGRITDSPLTIILKE